MKGVQGHYSLSFDEACLSRVICRFLELRRVTSPSMAWIIHTVRQQDYIYFYLGVVLSSTPIIHEQTGTRMVKPFVFNIYYS